MVDNIVAIATVMAPEDFYLKKSFVWKGIYFNPDFFKGTDAILKGYTSEYNGLRIYLKCDAILVSNSLHKYQKGNNYSDFSLSELKDAIDSLCRKLEVEPYRWNIKKLEFGFNIHTPTASIEYLDHFLSYKNKEFNKMMHGHKCYGRKCFMSEYGLKVYDKAFQVKAKDGVEIENNILRIEIFYSQKRKLPIERLTLQGLKDQNIIKLLFDDLLTIIRKTTIGKEIDFENSSYEDRLLYFAATNSIFIKTEKKLKNSNIKQIIRNISQLRERFLKKEFKDWLVNALKDKYIQLYCS